MQHLRTPRVRAGADRVVLGEVGPDGVLPSGASWPDVGVQLAQLAQRAPGSQLDPPEHRVADQHPEGPDVVR